MKKLIFVCVASLFFASAVYAQGSGNRKPSSNDEAKKWAIAIVKAKFEDIDKGFKVKYSAGEVAHLDQSSRVSVRRENPQAACIFDVTLYNDGSIIVPSPSCGPTP